MTELPAPPARPAPSDLIASQLLAAGLLSTIVLIPLRSVEPCGFAGRLAIVVAGIAGFVVYLQKRPRPAGLFVEAAFAVFVALSAASVLVSVDLEASSYLVSKILLRQLLLFLLVAGFAREKDGARSIAVALGLSGLLLSFDAVVRWAAGNRNVFGGLTGPAMDYNTLCMLLIPAMAALLALSAGAEGPRRAAAWGAGAAVVTAAAWATFSRIGWGAIAILVATFVFACRGRRARPLLAAAAGTLLFLSVFRDPRPYLTITDNDRFLVSWEEELTPAMTKKMGLRDILTMNSRLEYAWIPSLRLVRQSPLLGSGYGPATWAKVVPRDGPVLFHEHSTFLAVAVQSGIPAALAFAATLLALAAGLGRRALRDEVTDLAGALRAGVLAIVVGLYLFQGLGEPFNSGRLIGLQLAVVLGLGTALLRPEEGVDRAEGRSR